MGIREDIAINAQQNANLFRDFMMRERLKVCIFNLGPYLVTDTAHALVGMTAEILEGQGYNVELSPQILSMDAEPAPGGKTVIKMKGLTVLTVRAPVIIAPSALGKVQL
jgi:hypothetical protein